MSLSLKIAKWEAQTWESSRGRAGGRKGEKRKKWHEEKPAKVGFKVHAGKKADLKNGTETGRRNVVGVPTVRSTGFLPPSCGVRRTRVQVVATNPMPSGVRRAASGFGVLLMPP